jgi:DNA-binding response OmpR family regulator
VLVAEDEEFTLNLLREVLTAANFQVEAVTNVADAIAKISSFDPHAVITDLNFGIIGSSGASLNLTCLPCTGSAKQDFTAFWRDLFS